MSTPRKKIALELYDFDGCLFYDEKCAEKSHREWVIDNNQCLLEKTTQKIKENKFDKMIVGFFTNRQSEEIEFHHGVASAPILPVLQSYFSTQLKENKTEVVLDPFLLSDIYGHGGEEKKESPSLSRVNSDDSTSPIFDLSAFLAAKNGGNKIAGESYELILKKYQNIKTEKSHSRSAMDLRKINILYAHAHRVASLHPNDDIEIFVYDDLKKLLEDINEIYQHLPKNCKIIRMHYNPCRMAKEKLSTYAGDAMEVLTGKSEIDYNYDWTVRCMTLSSDGENLTAENLEKTHKNFSYHADVVINKEKINIENFKQMIAKSGLKNTLGKESNYTTAETLLKNGLIPKEYIYQPAKKEILLPFFDKVTSAIVSDYLEPEVTTAKAGK